MEPEATTFIDLAVRTAQQLGVGNTILLAVGIISAAAAWTGRARIAAGAGWTAEHAITGISWFGREIILPSVRQWRGQRGDIHKLKVAAAELELSARRVEIEARRAEVGRDRAVEQWVRQLPAAESGDSPRTTGERKAFRPDDEDGGGSAGQASG